MDARYETVAVAAAPCTNPMLTWCLTYHKPLDTLFHLSSTGFVALETKSSKKLLLVLLLVVVLLLLLLWA